MAGYRAELGGRGQRVLGEAAEDCLKNVFELQRIEGRASTSALAARLGVSEPTITAMVKRLSRMGLLDYTPYHGVKLSPTGEKLALTIIRHHRLVELYLVEALGLSWEKVHAEADRLEHTISEEVGERMDAALGRPTSDPHGHPIPSRDGEVEDAPHTSLLDLDAGASATVRQVPDHDPELLQYLAELGLVPNAAVRVVDKAPFGGPLTLQLGDKRQTVGSELARVVQVSQKRLREEKPGSSLEADLAER